jgi:hypothetical protein
VEGGRNEEGWVEDGEGAVGCGISPRASTWPEASKIITKNTF